MKCNTFLVGVFTFTATTGAIGTTAASLLISPQTATLVWIRRDELIPPSIGASNVFVGTHYLDVSIAVAHVIVNIIDPTTPGGGDTRLGRSSPSAPDAVIKTTSPTTITPSPLPIVP